MHRNTGLQVIFSVFLGLMLAVFLGVGVYTFYPPPVVEEAVVEDVAPGEVAPGEVAPGEVAPGEVAPGEVAPGEVAPGEVAPGEVAPQEKVQPVPAYDGSERARARDAWRQRTSIFLIVLATLSMIVSLIRSAQLPVISSGLLLGGVFTMVYGVGWTVSTGLSIGRFAVVTVAFVITLVLGWLRFSGHGSQLREGAVGNTGDARQLEARIRALEERLDSAGRSLRGDGSRGQDMTE